MIQKTTKSFFIVARGEKRMTEQKIKYSLYFSEKMNERLEQHVLNSGLKKSEVIKTAIDNYLCSFART